MKDFQEILDSFAIRKTLNPKVWDNFETVDDAKLKPEVRKKLTEISEEFIDYLGEDIFVDDVVLMGSLANYNWSEYSDFDLHVLVDFQQYEDEAELYKKLFDLKKTFFNEKHNIQIFGYDVEVYVQGIDEPNASVGIYSIMENEWVKKPKKEKPGVDFEFLKKKIKSWISKIEEAILDGDIEKLISLKDKIKKYRKSGLDKEGEYSYENLVFKFLRRSKMMEKLFDAINSQKSKKLSIEGIIKEEAEVGGKNVTDILMNSNFLKSMKELTDNNLKFEYTPGQKIPYEPPVELVQTGLQYLGFSLPKWGVDGKFGPETKYATEQFQEEYGLPVNGVMDIKDLKYLLGYLVLEGFDESKLSTIQKEKDFPSGMFTQLDLNDQIDFETYKEICQTFIDKRNSSAKVTGEMMANCAKRYFSQGYVPPELALAQLVQEGGISSDLNAKPIKTKNPFNVGNTDSGQINQRDSFQDGVCLYYDLMTRNYLPKGKSPESLLKNFINIEGDRYASDRNYENSLKKLISSISSTSQSVMTNMGLSQTDFIKP